MPIARKKILIVDDNEDILCCYSELLLRAGYRVREATNGQEALNALSSDPELGLILLDLEMSVMNGFQFLSYVRKDPVLSKIPIIICSGHVLLPDIATALELQYLEKPYESEALLSKVGALMAEAL